jgi:hypothetical protein
VSTGAQRLIFLYVIERPGTRRLAGGFLLELALACSQFDQLQEKLAIALGREVTPEQYRNSDIGKSPASKLCQCASVRKLPRRPLFRPTPRSSRFTALTSAVWIRMKWRRRDKVVRRSLIAGLGTYYRTIKPAAHFAQLQRVAGVALLLGPRRRAPNLMRIDHYRLELKPRQFTGHEKCRSPSLEGDASCGRQAATGA